MSSLKDLVGHHVYAKQYGGLPATTAMNAWYEAGGVITPEAFDQVAAVMRHDMLTQHRASGAGRFRPSNLGKCGRLQLFSYHGLPKDFHSDPDGEHLMGGGTWGHYRWQLAGLSHPFLTDIEVKVVSKKFGVSGSMDGVLTDESVFELKTTNLRRFTVVKKQQGPFPDHQLQAAGYMEATGREVTSIVYEHRDSGEYLEFRVPMNESLRLTLQMEVGTLVKHAKDKTLPPMLDKCLEKEGWTYHRCPYRISCPLLGDTWNE